VKPTLLVRNDPEFAVIVHRDVKGPGGIVNDGLVHHARAATLFHPDTEERVGFVSETKKLGPSRFGHAHLLCIRTCRSLQFVAHNGKC
jgi:hypothetical protein